MTIIHNEPPRELLEGIAIFNALRRPPEDAIRISTRSQDWAPRARAILWPHLAEKMR